MKDLSFFLLKNALGAKMRKSFKNLCHGDDSTSTVNQQKTEKGSGSGCIVGSPDLNGAALRESQPTLEEMILQLELEERAAKIAKLDAGNGEIRHRMSCVNSSDILRSARNALNQYPRFSLDGKDAMYRSSFRNMVPNMLSSSSQQGFYKKRDSDLEAERVRRQFPAATLGGESVVWCRPGVVAKLMGLESMPIPLHRFHRGDSPNAIRKRQQHHQRRKKAAARDHVIENARLVVGCSGIGGAKGSCSNSGYCVMKPLELGGVLKRPDGEVGWPMRHFL